MLYEFFYILKLEIVLIYHITGWVTVNVGPCNFLLTTNESMQCENGVCHLGNESIYK